MAVNRVAGYFEDQDRKQRPVESPTKGQMLDSIVAVCPNGHFDLLLPGPNGEIIAEPLNIDSEAWQGVREVLEECYRYRHGPPADVLRELKRRMLRLQRELLPQVFKALLRNKQFNPFDVDLNG